MQSLYAKLTLSGKGQYLVAALMWTIVGSLLLTRGVVFLFSGAHYFMLVMVLLLGVIKFFLVFRNIAQRNVSRINRVARKVFICSVFPLRTWILIAVMIIMGFLLRRSPLPRTAYSLLISGVGLGMFMASTIFWKAWMREAVTLNE